ncbi:MAG: anti-sigma regulatory factor [Deltaproteobacteria bacterium]|nr:anti-sigma regulatory factor [Deltaproteobacteria bacterium]MBW2021112.1 anti-sigma regulatory factor [Deltaproteobacteria bacterium]MBW2075819.1 anti-sigma regulatory factor [Deltaproteobacteria bacterium]
MTKTLVEILDQRDIITARQAGRNMVRSLGFGSADQTRVATAISELTRNVIQYAGEGVCIITDESNDSMNRIRVVVEDNGPGIADIDKAMMDGFSTGKSLGAGLPGTRRLAHEFEIESKPGHTKVSIVMKRRKL